MTVLPVKYVPAQPYPAGAPDDVIARELGFSERTYQRRVQAMPRRLHAPASPSGKPSQLARLARYLVRGRGIFGMRAFCGIGPLGICMEGCRALRR